MTSHCHEIPYFFMPLCRYAYYFYAVRKFLYAKSRICFNICFCVKNKLYCFSDSVDSAIERYNLQKVSLLRQFCLKVGIQILLKEYNLEAKNKQVFYEDDIINVFPIVKNIHPKVGTEIIKASELN